MLKRSRWTSALSQSRDDDSEPAPDSGSDSAAPPAHGFTARQLDVLRGIADGLSNSEIAERLGISLYTVKQHVRLLFAALNVESRTQAMIAGAKRRLI